MYWLRVIKAEMIKQHKNSFHSRMVYFSLLLWPILNFTNTYFSLKPFNMSAVEGIGLGTKSSLMTFLIIGFLGYLTFKSLMQSAWQMSNERKNGTLEMVFLSPANKLAIIYGRALGALLQNIWMFLIFSILVVFFIGGVPLTNIVYIPICFVLVIITATIWGGLLNVIFLFTRDAGILFMILDDPMMLFSGVRIPTMLFPVWAQIISVFYPLTQVLNIMRSLLIDRVHYDLTAPIMILLILSVVMIILTMFLLRKAEENARINGEFTFY